MVGPTIKDAPVIILVVNAIVAATTCTGYVGGSIVMTINMLNDISSASCFPPAIRLGVIVAIQVQALAEPLNILPRNICPAAVHVAGAAVAALRSRGGTGRVINHDAASRWRRRTCQRRVGGSRTRLNAAAADLPIICDVAVVAVSVDGQVASAQRNDLPRSSRAPYRLGGTHRRGIPARINRSSACRRGTMIIALRLPHLSHCARSWSGRSKMVSVSALAYSIAIGKIVNVTRYQRRRQSLLIVPVMPVPAPVATGPTAWHVGREDPNTNAQLENKPGPEEVCVQVRPGQVEPVSLMMCAFVLPATVSLSSSV